MTEDDRARGPQIDPSERGRRGDVVLQEVSKTYSGGRTEVRALNDVTLDVGAGEFVVLLGPSGSGKTTLLNLVGAIEPITTGTIAVSGIDVASLNGRDLTRYRRHEVGFVFQFFNLVPTLTASENVEVIAELTGPDAASRAEAALADVGMAGRSEHFPGQLSGGEQQRVAIARALAKQPSVILADEPTGSLDLETARQILDLLRASANRGTTVLFVTHNSAISNMADRVIHMRDGNITRDRRIDDPIAAHAVTW